MLFDTDSNDGYIVYVLFNSESSDIPSNSFYLTLEGVAEDIFTIGIHVKDINDLYGTAFTLRFDPSMLFFIDAREGAFLKGGGHSTSFMASLEEGNPGNLIIGHTRLGSVTGACGSGLLATVTFKVMREGESSLSFINASAFDSNGDIIDLLGWFGGVLQAVFI